MAPCCFQIWKLCGQRKLKSFSKISLLLFFGILILMYFIMSKPEDRNRLPKIMSHATYPDTSGAGHDDHLGTALKGVAQQASYSQEVQFERSEKFPVEPNDGEHVVKETNQAADSPLIGHQQHLIASVNSSFRRDGDSDIDHVEYVVLKESRTPPTKDYNIWNLSWPQLSYLQRNFRYEEVPFRKYSLDMEACQKTPLRRHIPDSRIPQCELLSYPSSLPKVSIVIPFYNEAWPNVLRTLHSIYERTPPRLLEEIILVSDNSDEYNNGEPLEKYVAALPKAILLRMKTRQGLIRTRLAGAHHARGEVLVFLDAHVECNVGWLEPLLNVVAQDRTTIAIPVSDYIDPKDLSYSISSRYVYGTFSWDLEYGWRDIMSLRYSNDTTPVATATHIGFALAVDHKFFKKIGEYDPELYIWGGENMELSFKSWMCGGGMKLVPCSRVGHLYRVTLPYYFPDKDSIAKNLQRVAEVWMDDYKRYYYVTSGNYHSFTDKDKQSLKERKLLRERLGCRSFEWFLKNIATDLITPPRNAVLFGQMKNIGFGACLKFDASAKKFLYEWCSTPSPEQTFAYNEKNQVTNGDKCLRYDRTKGGQVHPVFCDKRDMTQQWSFSPILPSDVEATIVGSEALKPGGSFRLIDQGYSLCLSAGFMPDGGGGLFAKTCSFNDHHQFWLFTYRLHNHIKWQGNS